MSLFEFTDADGRHNMSRIAGDEQYDGRRARDATSHMKNLLKVKGTTSGHLQAAESTKAAFFDILAKHSKSRVRKKRNKKIGITP